MYHVACALLTFFIDAVGPFCYDKKKDLIRTKNRFYIIIKRTFIEAKGARKRKEERKKIIYIYAYRVSRAGRNG